jgi:hypothetical protein
VSAISISSYGTTKIISASGFATLTKSPQVSELGLARQSGSDDLTGDMMHEWHLHARVRSG